MKDLMNPHNFYTIVFTPILLKVILMGIYKGKQNHTFSPLSSLIHLNFISVVFYGFEWMMAGTVQKEFVSTFHTEVYNHCFLPIKRCSISDLTYSVQTL